MPNQWPAFFLHKGAFSRLEVSVPARSKRLSRGQIMMSVVVLELSIRTETPSELSLNVESLA